MTSRISKMTSRISKMTSRISKNIKSAFVRDTSKLDKCHRILQEYPEFKHVYQRWIDKQNKQGYLSSWIPFTVNKRTKKIMALVYMFEIVDRIQSEIPQEHYKAFLESIEQVKRNKDWDSYDHCFRIFHRIICPHEYQNQPTGGRKTRRLRKKRPTNKF